MQKCESCIFRGIFRGIFQNTLGMYMCILSPIEYSNSEGIPIVFKWYSKLFTQCCESRGPAMDRDGWGALKGAHRGLRESDGDWRSPCRE